MKRLRQRIAYWLLGWPWKKGMRVPTFGCADPDVRLPEDLEEAIRAVQRRHREAVERLQAENWDEE